MDCLMGEVRRSVPYCVMALVVLNLLVDIRVARGELLHKNDASSSSSSATSNNSSNDNTNTTTTQAPTLRRVHTTEQSKGGEVGCHCNLPKCVTTSYMCKSTLGACFTRNTPTPTQSYMQSRNMYHRRAPMHGCVELLPPKDRHAECLKKAGVKRKVEEKDQTATANTSPVQEPDPELSCCSQDMCNYRDIGVYIKPDGTYDSQTDMNRRDSEMVDTLWFRAATIAVPIAGGFILIVLVLLASRMLSKENKRHRMAQVIGERYLKTPLYPGGSAEPLPHLPLYYHAPLSKAPSLAHSSHRASYEEKPCNYRPPDIQVCTLDEIKPLNILHPDGQWDQREETDSPFPS